MLTWNILECLSRRTASMRLGLMLHCILSQWHRQPSANLSHQDSQFVPALLLRVSTKEVQQSRLFVYISLRRVTGYFIVRSQTSRRALLNQFSRWLLAQPIWNHGLILKFVVPMFRNSSALGLKQSGHATRISDTTELFSRTRACFRSQNAGKYIVCHAI